VEFHYPVTLRRLYLEHGVVAEVRRCCALIRRRYFLMVLQELTTQRFSIQICAIKTKPNLNPNTNPNPTNLTYLTDPTKPYHLTVYDVGW